jgi:hypothetical protein
MLRDEFGFCALGGENWQGKRRDLSVPMLVKWRDPKGHALQERADAAEMSAKAILLEMYRVPPLGTEVTVVDAQYDRILNARIVRCDQDGAIACVLAELL